MNYFAWGPLASRLSSLLFLPHFLAEPTPPDKTSLYALSIPIPVFILQMDLLKVIYQDCTGFTTGRPTCWELLTLMLLLRIIREHSFLPLKSKDSNNHWGQQAESRAPESFKLGRKEPELEPEKKHQKPKKTVAFPLFLQWTNWSQTLLNRKSNSEELYRL